MMHTKVLEGNYGVHNLCVEYDHSSRVQYLSKQPVFRAPKRL